MSRPGRILASAALAAALAGCGGSLVIKKPEQGLTGSFITYGPPTELADCSPLKTQFQKDSCRHDNERVVEMAYQGSVRILNLDTRKAVDQPLDAQGSYRAILDPGNYEVCVNEECSDPIEVRRSEFATYGQRLPRAATAGKSPARKDSTGAAPVKIP
jgi:hypothetical protein